MVFVKIITTGHSNAFNAERPNNLIFIGYNGDNKAVYLMKDNVYARVDAVKYFDSVEFGDTVEVKI